MVPRFDSDFAVRLHMRVYLIAAQRPGRDNPDGMSVRDADAHVAARRRLKLTFDDIVLRVSRQHTDA